MRPKLYSIETCPGARAVLLTARVLGVTLEVRELNITGKAGCYTKDSPKLSVPTLEDNGYIIWDSHRIIAYLVGKYGIDDSLYPRDMEKRCRIDQRLHFDSGVISFFFKTVLGPIIYEDNTKRMTNEQLSCLTGIYEVIERFFEEDNVWITGNEFTIADLCLIPSVSSLDAVFPIDRSRYPKVINWLSLAKSMPFYEANKSGVEKLRSIFRC